MQHDGGRHCRPPQLFPSLSDDTVHSKQGKATEVVVMCVCVCVSMWHGGGGVEWSVVVVVVVHAV